MASLFISYSRRDIEVARTLTESFKGQELDFWIDWEGIEPTVDWWREIEKGIEQADNFLFLISPDSARSKVCKKEIEYAAKNGKRLIPIVVRDIQAEESPSELSPLNWIFLRDEDDFKAAFGKLIQAVKTDYAWVQFHRRLQVKALEWERSDHENSLLLRGNDLQAAEAQLVTNTSKEPHPTDIQREYVLRSRQASDRQRRVTMGITIAVGIALAALAIFGFVQAELAQQRATLSRAGELAAQSAAVRDTQLDLSLLLSIAAFRTADIPRTRTSLLDSTQARPELSQYLYGTSVAISPDGKMLAIGSADGSILLRDLATRQTLGMPLIGHTDKVWSVVFSPDGKTLASSSVDNAIILWDLTTRALMSQPLIGDTGKISTIAFSPDGKILAAGNWSDTIKLWEVETGQAIGPPLTAHTDGVASLAFSPDGKKLASGGWTTIILWDLATRKAIGKPFTAHTEPINSMAFSPDGKILASGSDDNSVILWDVETGQPIGQPLWMHRGTVYSVAFSPDGKTLASGSDDNTIILWDVETRQPIGQPLAAQTSAILTLAFSRDGWTLVASSADGIIVLWDRASQPPIGRRLIGHADFISVVVFSPDGKILASGSCGELTRNDDCLKGQIILWDVETGKAIGQPLIAHADWVRSVAFSPDGRVLASASCAERIQDMVINSFKCVRGEIVLWDVETRQVIAQRTMETAGLVDSVAFSPDGRILASAFCKEQIQDTEFNSFECVRGQIILWDSETGKAMGQPITEPSGRIRSVAFSPDGKTLAAGNWDFRIILWDVATHAAIGQPLMGHTGSVSMVVFSPDGKMLASTSADGSSILWDVANHTILGEPLRGYATGSYATSVAFSPDGKTLAWGNWDHTILLWDVETQELISQPLKGHSDVVLDAAFSPDGKLLASSSQDNTIILWDMDPQSWTEISCRRAGRNFTPKEWTVYFSGEPYPAKQEDAICPQWPLEPQATPTPATAP